MKNRGTIKTDASDIFSCDIYRAVEHDFEDKLRQSSRVTEFVDTERRAVAAAIGWTCRFLSSIPDDQVLSAIARSFEVQSSNQAIQQAHAEQVDTEFEDVSQASDFFRDFAKVLLKFVNEKYPDIEPLFSDSDSAPCLDSQLDDVCANFPFSEVCSKFMGRQS